MKSPQSPHSSSLWVFALSLRVLSELSPPAPISHLATTLSSTVLVLLALGSSHTCTVDGDKNGVRSTEIEPFISGIEGEGRRSQTSSSSSEIPEPLKHKIDWRFSNASWWRPAWTRYSGDVCRRKNSIRARNMNRVLHRMVSGDFHAK